MWRPIISGTLAERALAAVADIIGAMRAHEAEAQRRPGLADGAAGLALLHAYVDTPSSEVRATDLLTCAIELIDWAPVASGLFSGRVGVAWAVAHLSDDADDDATELALLRLLDAAPPWAGPFDLADGLVGFGVYAAERSPRPTSDGLLRRIVHHLAVIEWHTPAWLLPEWQRAETPRGRSCTGPAYGVAGVIATCAAAVAAGIDEARDLLPRAVDAVLARRHGDAFPPWIAAGDPPRARIAWCDGNLGIAAALVLAARAHDREDWRHAAIELALAAARRAVDDHGVVDAGLCHGAAGVAHALNRIAQATDHDELAAAARSWYERLLGMRVPQRGIAGYRAWEPLAQRWVDDPGLLRGAAGIALTLVAAATDGEPEWDRALAMSTSR